MERHGPEVHVTETEASAGAKRGVLRYILIISLALAVLAMTAIWIVGALNAPQGSHTAPVTNQAPPSGS